MENKNKQGRASKYYAVFREARNASFTALCLPNTFKASIRGEQRELSAEIEISNKVGTEEKKKKNRSATPQGAAGSFIWATYSIIVNGKSETKGEAENMEVK